MPLARATYLCLLIMSALTIQDLYANVGDQKILKGVSLKIPKGEVHAVMGKNGSGKSTLAKIIAGHPNYTATAGSVMLDGKNLLAMEPNERACLGVFLAFQYPVEIPGVTVANFIRAAIQAKLPKGKELEATEYYSSLYQQMDSLQIPRAFTSRSINEGFSGGEKKRCEILQMAMLQPTYAILDETDSGLDIDALKVVSEGVNTLRGPHVGILIITHYQRLLNYIVPDRVHVMMDGRVARSGGRELALQLEAGGYDWLAAPSQSCSNGAPGPSADLLKPT
jgi:Fe-S cluster assembly ATP-binding protein